MKIQLIDRGDANYETRLLYLNKELDTKIAELQHQLAPQRQARKRAEFDLKKQTKESFQYRGEQDYAVDAQMTLLQSDLKHIRWKITQVEASRAYIKETQKEYERKIEQANKAIRVK